MNKKKETTTWKLSAKICIAEALISLMETKKLKEIHIQDLVKKAGVSRMSYYRYFHEKEDILKYYMEYIFQKYKNTIDTKENISFQSYEHILHTLCFFKKYQNYALCLEKAGLSYIVLDTLNEYIQQQPASDESSAKLCYPFYYYAGALYNTYMQWILNDTKESPEEIATLLSSFHTLEPIKQKPSSV